MRIACIYLPSFPLQVHVRNAPHLSGMAAVAVADTGERPTLVACSRQAWDQGVRPGMSVSQARAIAPDARIITGDPELYRRAAQSLGESLLSFSVTVDIGDGDPPHLRHKAIYLHVPTGSRGARFGEMLLAHLDAQGFRGRVGVADDRFTAWAAAAVTPRGGRHDGKHDGKHEPQLSMAAVTADNPNFVRATTTVPRGGAAAFLSPLPLSLLPLENEVRTMLHTLGIHTLGDFAALPPPSVGRRWHQQGVDYQALAHGEGPAILTGLTPSETIVETVECDDEITDLEPLSFLLRPLVDRACERLRGRGMAAGELALTLSGSGSRPDRSNRTRVVIAPSRPTLAGSTLLDLVRAKLSELTLEHPVVSLHLEITTESEPEVCELDLFVHRDADVSADAVDVAIARLQAALGEENVRGAELVDTHRPERAFKLTPFAPPRRQGPRSGSSGRRGKGPRRAQRKRRAAQPAPARSDLLPIFLTGMSGALRLVDPPCPQPTALRTIEHGGTRHKVVASHGPTRLDTEWWEGDEVGRDYYEVETDDGGRYWVFRAKKDGRYYLHGVFD